MPSSNAKQHLLHEVNIAMVTIACPCECAVTFFLEILVLDHFGPWAWLVCRILEY